MDLESGYKKICSLHWYGSKGEELVAKLARAKFF